MAWPASAELHKADRASLAFHALGSAEVAGQHAVEPAWAAQQGYMPGPPCHKAQSGTAV